MKKIILFLFIISVSLHSFANPPKGTTYAVIIGISKYIHTNVAPNLTFPTADADRVKEYLVDSKGGNVPEANIIVLKDEAATRQGILDAMENMFSKATEDDRIIFDFSGHGADGVFSTHEINVGPSGFLNVLSFEDVKSAFKKSKAKTKICIADACHSGGMKFKDAPSSTRNMEAGLRKLTTASGQNIIIMMSSRASEASKELSFMQQGVFSFNLLEGLRGKADLNKDKLVTAKELYQYVRTRVRAFTHGAQTPVMFGKFNPNMSLAVL